MRRISFSVFLLTISGALALAPCDVVAQDPIRQAIADGELAKARTMLESGTHEYSEAETLELLTQVCNAQIDYVAGIRYGKQAIAEAPNSSNAHFQYAVALRNKMAAGGKMKAMLAMGSYKKQLRKALELDPENVDALEERIGFLIKAPGIAGGDAKSARELIPQLKALDKLRGLEMEVLLENTKGDPSRASGLLEQALGEAPDNLELRNRYAVQLQKDERYRDADAEFRKIEAADGDTRLALLALYQRARTRILGRFEQDEAVEILLRYLEAVPEDRARLPTRSNAYWRMGNAYEQLDQNVKARAAYSKALKLDPENAQAKKSLKALPR